MTFVPNWRIALTANESSHKEVIIIFITNKDLNMTKKSVIEDDDGNFFELYYP